MKTKRRFILPGEICIPTDVNLSDYNNFYYIVSLDKRQYIYTGWQNQSYIGSVYHINAVGIDYLNTIDDEIIVKIEPYIVRLI